MLACVCINSSRIYVVFVVITWVSETNEESKSKLESILDFVWFLLDSSAFAKPQNDGVGLTQGQNDDLLLAVA